MEKLDRRILKLEIYGSEGTHLNRDGLSLFTVHGIPAANNSGYGCSLIFLHRWSSSLDIGQSSIQMPGFSMGCPLSPSSYSSFGRGPLLKYLSSSGCFMSENPCPIRFDLRRTASYRFELLGSVEPPVSNNVSPAWKRKGISNFCALQVSWNATNS